FAASLINAGVSKSGSPAPKPTTSIPAFFIAFALALTARVIDSDTSFTRSASGNIAKAPADLHSPPDPKGGKRLVLRQRAGAENGSQTGQAFQEWRRLQ